MLHDIYKETSVFRPIEVVTSVERRRRWSREEKARIVEASFAPGVTVVEVARRHEISPQHLHQWRRAARGAKLIVPLDDEMTFATVMIDGAQNDRQRASGGVEVEIQGAVLRVNAGTDLHLMTAVVRALKAAGDRAAARGPGVGGD